MGKRHEQALIKIEELVFCNEMIPLSIRERIQEIIIVDAGINPPSRQFNLENEQSEGTDRLNQEDIEKLQNSTILQLAMELEEGLAHKAALPEKCLCSNL